MLANHPYVFQFYATPLGPLPGALVVSPTTLTINGTGSANAQTFTASETGYTGTLTESDTCSGIATVSFSSSSGPSSTVTVTGVAGGTCSVTVTDAFGQQASSAITVTITNLGVQSRAHKEGQP